MSHPELDFTYNNITYTTIPETRQCQGCIFDAAVCQHPHQSDKGIGCGSRRIIFIVKDTILSTENSGLNGLYYEVEIKYPTNPDKESYLAECNDITEALNMTPHEYNIFKSIWRKATARLGNGKVGNKALYDAEKCLFASQRMVILEKQLLKDNQLD